MENKVLILFIGLLIFLLILNYFNKMLSEYFKNLNNDTDLLKEYYIKQVENISNNFKRDIMDLETYLIEMYKLLKNGVEYDLRTKIAKQKLIELIFFSIAEFVVDKGIDKEILRENISRVLTEKKYLLLQNTKDIKLVEKTLNKL